jgi:hypothetical protein
MSSKFPGNIGLSKTQSEARIREIFRPYHDRIAGELDRRHSTTDLESVAAKVGTKPVGDGKIDIRQQGSASTTLVGHYEKPYRLFYKVEEVQFASSGLNGDLKLSRHPVTATLDWHEPAHAE